MSNYTKEQVQKYISEFGKIGDTDTHLQIINAMKLNNGLLLNLNNEYIANTQWLFDGTDENEATELIYVNVDEHKNYIFTYKSRDAGKTTINNLSAYDLCLKILNHLYNKYGRDVAFEFNMSYETGTMLVTPNFQLLSEDEAVKIFKEHIEFQSNYLKGRMSILNQEYDKYKNLVAKTYGKEFIKQTILYNLPLWVEIFEDVDVFKQYKIKAYTKFIAALDLKIQRMEENKEPFEYSMEPFAAKTKPETTYKLPIEHDRSTFRKEVAKWVYMPVTTLEFMGISSLKQLVDKYL